jgi:hypothetical protein
MACEGSIFSLVTIQLVIQNYEHFENFKGAIFGFFSLLSGAGMNSELKETLRHRVSDNFSPIQAPAAVF